MTSAEVSNRSSISGSFRVGETRANGRRASDGRNVAAAVIETPNVLDDPIEVVANSTGDQPSSASAIPPKPPTVTISESEQKPGVTPTTGDHTEIASAHSPAPRIDSSASGSGAVVGAAAGNSSKPARLDGREQNQFSVSAVNIEHISRAAPASADQQAAAPELVTETVRFSGTPDAFGGYNFAAMDADGLAEVSSALGGFHSYNARASAAPVNPFDLSSAANSVKIVLHDQTTSGSTIDFIKAPDTESLGLPPLPAEHTFFGLWKLDSAGEFATADIEVRYDDILASRLGLDEHWVKLWVCDGSTWNLLMNDPSFGRDTDRNLVWASASGFEYFAVSTPEPAALGVLFASALLALRRRR